MIEYCIDVWFLIKYLKSELNPNLNSNFTYINRQIWKMQMSHLLNDYIFIWTLFIMLRYVGGDNNMWKDMSKMLSKFYTYLYTNYLVFCKSKIKK